MTRSGTAHKKTRYEVRGSAQKIRPQKGSGRARLGDKKSPMLRGGGLAHGPRHRDFSTELPKKVYDLAWRTALSYRWRKGELIIVDNAIELESPSRHLLNHIFELHDRERGKGRSLLVTSQNRPLLEQALEKMDRPRQALIWDDVDVKDLLELSRIVIERQALWKIFASHRSDLTSYVPLPFDSEPKKPESYEFIAGWPQFRALMTASPAERETVRAEAYESTAFQRWQHAESLPTTDAHKLSLTVSAFELLSEAKDLQREQLPTAGSLQLAIDQAEEVLTKLPESDPQTGQASIAAAEAQLALDQRNLDEVELLAQAAEHRRDAFRFKGEEEEAKEQEEIAGDFRTDVALAEEQVLKTRVDLARYCYEDAMTKEGDGKEARKHKAELEKLQKKLDAVMGARDAAEQDEEYSAEELKQLEAEVEQGDKAAKKS